MRHRQETVVKKGWDGEFETYDEWARFGPLPPYRSTIFLDAHGRRCITQQDFDRARDGGTFPVRYYLAGIRIVNALKRAVEPPATTRCWCTEATRAMGLVHLCDGGPKSWERGYRHHAR